MKLENLQLKGQRVLMRVDFNVPLNAQFEVTDDTRISAALPTIHHILQNGGRVILMSHLGRPEKKLKEDGSVDKEKFTLRHIVPTLSALLGQTVHFVDDTIGTKVEAAAAALKDGEVLLLENTRFYKEETKGNEDFARSLAAFGDVYINDAFGAAHREHASTATVAKFFANDKKAFGFLMRTELESASKLLTAPQRPYIAILGGAKVSDKILLLEKLVDIVDTLIIGGGMAYTLLKAQGAKIGSSLVEEDKLDVAKEFLEKAAQKGIKVLLPEDSVVADKFDNAAATQIVSSFEVPDGWMGLDIGPKAIALFTEAILSAKSVLWNGPMGVFEMSNFAKGTTAIADAVAQATHAGAFSLVGGGDSVSALHQAGKADEVSHVSTGGGATLEYLQGNLLPGVEAIEATV
jgi:phosphoglycerate kinase